MPGLVEDATGNNLTYRIIGAAMDVHNDLGPGYKEEIYERALAAKLQTLEIPAQSQYPVDIVYDGCPIATFYLDLFVDELVVVELKAFAHQLTNDELAQVLNYLKVTNAPVGLLFNFGRRKLEYHRVFPVRQDREVVPQRLARDNAAKRAVHE